MATVHLFIQKLIFPFLILLLGSCTAQTTSNRFDFDTDAPDTRQPSSSLSSPSPSPSPDLVDSVRPVDPFGRREEDPVTEEEKKQNQIWQQKWRNRTAIAVFNRILKKPAPLVPIPRRSSFRKVSRPTLNLNKHISQIKACMNRYDDQWKSVPKIVDQLSKESESSCWPSEVKQEVRSVTSQIQANLNQIKAELSRIQNKKNSYFSNQRIKKEERDKIIELMNQLGGNYQQLQESLSYCRLKRVIQSSLQIITPLSTSIDPEPNADDRALLHVLGDVFGHKSGLEGQSISNTIRVFERRKLILEQIQHQLERQMYIQSELQAEPCRDIQGGYHPEDFDHAVVPVDLNKEELVQLKEQMNTAITLMKAFSRSFEEFVKEYFSQIEKLSQEGDWFFFEAGSVNHAVIYAVLKEQKNRFSFRVYNSGDGLEFHSSILDGSNRKVFPFIERRGLLKEKVTQISFLKALYDLSNQHEHEFSNSKITFFYDNILQELGGTLTTQRAHFETFLDPQIAGNCTYYVLPYMEASRASHPSMNYTLEFFIKSIFLDVYFKFNQVRLQQNSDLQRLTHKALTFYSEEVARNISPDPSKKGRYIDWGMARESAERITQHHEMLAALAAEKIEAGLQTAPSFHQNGFNWEKSYIPNSNIRFLFQIQPKVKPSSSIISCLKVENWQPQPDRIQSDLKTLLDQLEPKLDYTKNEDGLEIELQKILGGIPEIVKRIPLDREWMNKLEDENFRLFLGQLNDLSQFHFWALVRSRLKPTAEKLGLSPISILTQVRLLSLADLALQVYGTREIGRHFQSFPSLCSSQLHRLLISHEKKRWISLLSIQDHFWMTAFHELVRYWENQNDSINQWAFQWDRFPLYVQNGNDFSRYILKNLPVKSCKVWSKPYADPSGFFWNDLHWASQFLKQGQGEGKRTEWKDVIEAVDFNKNRLPIEFFEVRDISFLTHYTLTGSFSAKVLIDSGLAEAVQTLIKLRTPHHNRVSGPINFSLKPETESPSKYFYKNSYCIFGKTLVLRDAAYFMNPGASRLIKHYSNFEVLTGDSNHALELGGERSYLGLWNQLLEAREPYLSLEKPGQIGTSSFYRSYGSAQIISSPQLTHFVPLRDNPSQTREIPITDLELQRQLLNLNTPLTTLSYFREHPDLLREKRWQILFKALMFQPQLLIEELEKTQILPVLLSNFCWLNFEKQVKLQDNSTASFFLRMHQLLEEFTKSEGRGQEWPKNRVAREGFKRILKSLHGISDIKFQIYRDLLRTYKYVDLRNETPLDLAHFVEAVVYRDRNSLQEHELNFDVDEENAIFGIYQQKRENLNLATTRFSETERDFFFNHINQAFRSEEPELKSFQRLPEKTSVSELSERWQGQADDHTIVIDLSRPVILNDQHEDISLPAKIFELPLFKKLVHWDHNEPYVKWLGGEKYELKDLNSHLIRIDASPSPNSLENSLRIQKKWGAQWYLLLSDSYVNQRTINPEGAENWDVMPGFHNWQWVSTETELRADYSPEAYGKLDEGSWWEKWEDLKQPSPLWDRNQRAETLVFDQDEEKLFAVIRKRSEAMAPVIQKVKYEEGKPYIYGTQLNRIGGTFEFLKRIEHPRFIWIWKNKQNTIEKIEFPRFGVSFHLEEGQLVSPELGSFALSETQILPRGSEIWGNYTHYLMLEKNGQRQVIVPIIRPVSNKKGGLFVRHHLDWLSRSEVEAVKNPDSIHIYGRNSQKFLVWPIDRFDHELKLSTFEDQFLLSLIHLWEVSSEYPAYDRARELLYGSRSDLGDFRADPSDTVISGAREILDWLFSIPTKDYDPRAVALRLGAAAMILENDFSNQRLIEVDVVYENNTGKKNEKIWTSEFLSKNTDLIFEEYFRYFDIRDKISTRWFPEDLERLLLHSLLSIFPDNQRLQARRAELLGNDQHQIVHKKATSSASFSYARSFHYTELEQFKLDENGCKGASESNLYHGIIPSKEDLYYISIQMDQPHLIETDLRALLAKTFGVDVKVLSGKKFDQLKSEYLNYLRYFIRQRTIEKRRRDSSALNDDCLKMMEFMYAVASSNGDRRELKNLTLVGKKFNSERIQEMLKRSWPDPDWFEKWTKNKTLIDSAIVRMGLNRVDWRFLSTRSTHSTIWSDRNRTFRRARYWDPRTESVPQVGFDYQYDRISQTIDAPYDLYEAPILSSLKMEKILNQRDLNLNESSELKEASRSLQRIFSVTPLEAEFDESDANYDPFIQKKLNDYRQFIRMKEESDLGLSSIRNEDQDENETQCKKRIYEWTNTEKPLESLNELRKFLPGLQNRLDRELQEARKLQREIEKEVQALPVETWSIVKEQLFRESSVEVRPSLKELIHIYASRKFSQIFVLNAGLKLEEARAIFEKLTSFLIRSTYCFRLQETIRSLNQLSADSEQDELKAFYQTATATRQYKIEENPDYLVFEYMTRMLIREDQIKNLNLLTKDKSTLLEMIMGAGKTSVLLPLASHRNAVAGKQLSVVVLPESLLPSMIKQLSTQLKMVFNQGVDRISIQRKHKYDLEKLNYLYSRLRQDLDQEKVVVISNSSVQSLFLIFVEKIYEYKSIKNPDTLKRVKKEISVMQYIFQLFRGYGHVLIDEVDSILDIMSSHRFSVGHRTQIETSTVDATIGLYQILADDPQIHQSIKIPFIIEVGPGSRPFSRDNYAQYVKGRLIDRITDKASAFYFFEQSDWIKQFKNLDMGKLKEYFYSTSPSETRDFLNSLPSDQLRNVISVLFTQVHQILPMTLDKMYLVHYGLCPEDKSLRNSDPDSNVSQACHPFIGIPYHSGVPVLNSRFGTDLESLNYTIQSHLENRDVLEMFKLEINRLKRLFRQTRSQIVRDKIDSYFDHPLSDGQILNLSEAEIVTQAKIVSTRLHLVLGLVKTYGVPKIEVFPNQLFTNSYIYPILFKKLQGMTGTLWNYESFPEFYTFKKESDSLARTLTALWKRPLTREVIVVDNPTGEQKIEETLRMMFQDKDTVSIIDQGGFFRGKENQDVVESILNVTHQRNEGNCDLKIHQLVFYDSNHQLQVMSDKSSQKTIRPYIARDIDRSQTGAFWDMQHTTGSDLKVCPKTVALLTLSKFSIMRDLLQSAWRLRDLEQSQSVLLTVGRDDLRVMSKLLVDHFGAQYAIDEKAEKVPLGKILLYLATHEAIKVGELNYRSVKGSQRAIIFDKVFDKIMDPASFGNNLIHSFDHIRSFFSSPRTKHPFERYGIPFLKTNTVEFLTNEIQTVFEPVKKAFGNLNGIEEMLNTIVSNKKDLLRKNVVTSLRVEENEEEMEQEQEQEQEREQEVELINLDPLYKKPAVPWNREKFLSGELWRRPTTSESLPEKRLSSDDISKLSPVMSLREILEKKELGGYSHLFDPLIRGSLNLFPVFQSNFLDHDFVFNPFGVYQGFIDFAWVVLDKNEVLKSVTLMTRDEALEIMGPWLIEDQDLRFSRDSDYVSLIYQIGNGFIRFSGDLRQLVWEGENWTDTLFRLEELPEFQRILTQIKFLSGRVNYTEAQRQILSDWMSHSNDVSLFYDLFDQRILKFKPRTREEFESSELRELLTTLKENFYDEVLPN